MSDETAADECQNCGGTGEVPSSVARPAPDTQNRFRVCWACSGSGLASGPDMTKAGDPPWL